VIRVLSIFGTRPEAVKMAPVIRALTERPDRVESRICVSAQHRGMLDQMLSWFSLRADYDMDIMSAGQTPLGVAALVLAKTEAILAAERPDWVLVQGDTTTATAAALAASYAHIRVGHIEAGLRSFDRTRPFPEEINRRVITAVADLHFAPTARARGNLLREGIPAECIIVTGNTGIDALLQTVDILDLNRDGLPWRHVPPGDRVILVTAHRQESLGHPLRETCRALREIADCHPDTHIVFPVHPRPEVRRTAHEILGNRSNIVLCDPLDYHSMVQLMLRCEFLITDSGGLQEEAPALGKPVLVLREVTERPEAIEAGAARLVGITRERIIEEANRLLDCPEVLERMAHPAFCYGDGHAAERIAAAVLGDPVEEWDPRSTAWVGEGR
jgi:UDP-N-acetylglucosamine 2-epimerase (non-hydrolysing)